MPPCVYCTRIDAAMVVKLFVRCSVVVLWALNARHVEVFVKHLCRDILRQYVCWVVVCADLVY